MNLKKHLATVLWLGLALVASAMAAPPSPAPGHVGGGVTSLVTGVAQEDGDVSAAIATAQAFMGSWFGRLLLFGFSYALFYHLCNGVRHLLWDIGWGFDLPTFRTTGLTVVAASVVLTIVTWIAAYAAA